MGGGGGFPLFGRDIKRGCKEKMKKRVNYEIRKEKKF
jgi:hypothetical protein